MRETLSDCSIAQSNQIYSKFPLYRIADVGLQVVACASFSLLSKLQLMLVDFFASPNFIAARLFVCYLNLPWLISSFGGVLG